MSMQQPLLQDQMQPRCSLHMDRLFPTRKGNAIVTVPKVADVPATPSLLAVQCLTAEPQCSNMYSSLATQVT